MMEIPEPYQYIGDGRPLLRNGELWYLLDCRYTYGDWIETHSPNLWQVHGQPHHAEYWVNERLMTLINLGAGIEEYYARYI